MGRLLIDRRRYAGDARESTRVAVRSGRDDGSRASPRVARVGSHATSVRHHLPVLPVLIISILPDQGPSYASRAAPRAMPLVPAVRARPRSAARHASYDTTSCECTSHHTRGRRGPRPALALPAPHVSAPLASRPVSSVVRGCPSVDLSVPAGPPQIDLRCPSSGLHRIPPPSCPISTSVSPCAPTTRHQEQRRPVAAPSFRRSKSTSPTPSLPWAHGRSACRSRRSRRTRGGWSVPRRSV